MKFFVRIQAPAGVQVGDVLVQPVHALGRCDGRCNAPPDVLRVGGEHPMPGVLVFSDAASRGAELRRHLDAPGLVAMAFWPPAGVFPWQPQEGAA